MIKKKIKFEKLSVELASVARWNICQKIAKLLYTTDLKEKDLMEGAKEIVRYLKTNNK